MVGQAFSLPGQTEPSAPPPVSTELLPTVRDLGKSAEAPMAKYELTKNLEAKKLNLRTKLPVAGPPVTMPFAAIIDNLEEVRDDCRFTYLGEWYSCPISAMKPALSLIGETQAEAGPSAPAAGPGAAPVEYKLRWEPVSSSHFSAMRAKVPGGWLVSVARGETSSLVFCPDADHAWE